MTFARIGVAIIGVALALSLTGCGAAAPPTVDDDRAVDVSPDSTPDEAPDAAPAITSKIDPAWPWPEDIAPRPAGIVSEFSGPNPLGDGGVYTIDFTASDLAEVQAYADRLQASGWSFLMGSSEPLLDGDSAAWSISRDKAFGAITADLSVTPVAGSISFIGSLG